MRPFLCLIFLLRLLGCRPGVLPQSEAPLGGYEAAPGVAPRNVVLMIGNGMGLSQISGGYYANGDQLSLVELPVTGLQKNTSLDAIAADQAAAATAFSTGQKVYNGALATLTDTFPLTTIMEQAAARGMLTGIVTTSELVHPTPAAFVAHASYYDRYEEIAAAFAESDVDLLIGGGRRYFTQRGDGRNLVDAWERRGYQVGDWGGRAYNTATENLVLFTAEGEPVPDAAGQTYLAPAGRFACEFLADRAEGRGFFLLIDAAGMDISGRRNDADALLAAMLDFDGAVGAVLDFARAERETLLIVTGDHETGGFAINAGSRRDSFLTAFTSKGRTGAMLPVFAYGPGAELFAGIYENTRIYWKMAAALYLDRSPDE